LLRRLGVYWYDEITSLSSQKLIQYLKIQNINYHCYGLEGVLPEKNDEFIVELPDSKVSFLFVGSTNRVNMVLSDIFIKHEVWNTSVFALIPSSVS
jgi:hypothetical protein